MSTGQLNSIIEHPFVSWFHIAKSSLLWGALAAVMIDIFHQYSRNYSLYIYIYPGTMEIVMFFAWIKLLYMEVQYFFVTSSRLRGEK